MPHHLFLSPHADDAPLSCGGQIATLVRQRHPVTIFTLMIAEPPAKSLDTALARYFHAKWKVGADVVTVRRNEDRMAAQRLGAEISFGELLEAGYRLTPTGDPCYAQPEALHQQLHPDDPLLTLLNTDKALALIEPFALQAGDVVHVPLGVGGHVDHQIVRDLGLLLHDARGDLKIMFYEEYPYAGWNDQTVPKAVNALKRSVHRIIHPLTLRARLLRIASIAAYRSQLPMIWPRGTLGMAIRTWQFISRVGGEAEWEMR